MKTTTIKSEYDLQAEAWAMKYNVHMTATFTGHRKHFADDTDTRDVYSITLSRNTHRLASMNFDFGQSLNGSTLCAHSRGKYWDGIRRKQANARSWYEGQKIGKGKTPSLYDILSCIEKGEPEPFESWCSNYGYDTDSRKALNTYLGCQKQLYDFRALCNGDPEMIREAQDIS